MDDEEKFSYQQPTDNKIDMTEAADATPTTKRKLYMHEKFKALRNFALNNEPIRVAYDNQKL